MENKDASANGGDGAAPTLDQVYEAIMLQKRKAQELPPGPGPGPEPTPLGFRSGLGASLHSSTLEQLLFQGFGAGPEEGQVGPLSVMRTNTMENILRETLSSGRELQDLMLEWNQTLPDEKFAEGLASDMRAIDAVPPDVQTLRRTFTLERIFSAAEADLAGMLRASQQQQQGGLPRQQSGAAAAVAAGLGGVLHRQQSGGGAAAAAAAGGSDAVAGGSGDAGQPSRLGGLSRPTEKLQRQESLHRLAASSGPSQQPPWPNAGPTMGPPCSRGPTGLQRAAAGSGRFGAAAAAALAAEEEAAPRSPKRHKLHHLAKAEASTAPERTWSQSLLDLAKAAAALDGRDLDEEDLPVGQKEFGGAAGDGGDERKLPYKAHTNPQGQQAEGAAGGNAQQGGRGRGQERRAEPGARGAAGPPGPADADADGRGEGGNRGGVGLRGHGAAGVGLSSAGGSAVSASNAAQLLQSLSGMKAGGGSGGQRGAVGGLPGPQQPSQQDQKLLQKLQAEAERLQRDNEGLNGQLEAVLGQIDFVQQKNARMKQMLLDACHAKGIQADLELLNVSLQHHRAQPMGEAQATHVAATVLGLNGGDVLATVRQLIGIALLRISEGYHQQQRG